MITLKRSDTSHLHLLHDADAGDEWSHGETARDNVHIYVLGTYIHVYIYLCTYVPGYVPTYLLRTLCYNSYRQAQT